ncbi:MAG: hypothetical protein P8N09_03790 [Planctomycetota bacterium]|nr:hypothetical protein [Planctomycetota bacterium]
MHGMWRVFRAECMRLMASRSAAASAIFLVMVPALRVFAAHAAASAEHAAAVHSALSKGRAIPELPPLGNAYGPLVDGWSAGLVLGALMLLAYSARSLASDRATGLARLATTRSASRSALVWGRALLGLPVSLAVILLTGLGATVAAGAWFTFGPLVEDGYQLMSHTELVDELVKSVLATLPPLIALWSLGLLVASMSRSGSGALFLALGIFLGFDLFKDLLGDARYYCFASFCPSLVDDSCIAEMAGVARGMSDAGFSENLYRMNLMLPIPEALVLITLAGWILSRRSL